MPDLSLERNAGGVVAGIDEVGRGPLAGPVLAAAVVLGPDLPADLAGAIDDSKTLSPTVRRRIAAALPRYARIGIGAASVAEIDRLNILQASLLAMRRALSRLPVRPSLALVDGNRLPQLPCPARAVIGGDGISLSIAAASIIAKVLRDELMRRLALRYPGYAWDSNAGYGTEDHRAALARLGCTPHHRQSFAPVRRARESINLGKTSITY